MNGLQKIERAFSINKKIRIMTHIVAGYPSLDESEEIVRAMARAGADCVEIQIPFSDPTADGPAIVRANTEALKTGIILSQVVEMTGRLAQSLDIPILIMSYINPVFAYGVESFIQDITRLGISGVILPDCPPDDDLGIIDMCNRNGIAFVPLVAPSTSDDRIREISSKTKSPFVYTVTRLGITGRRTEISADAKEYFKRVQSLSGKYCAVGFGIREKDQIQSLAGLVECAIVGSAVTETIRAAVEHNESVAEKTGQFVSSLIV